MDNKKQHMRSLLLCIPIFLGVFFASAGCGSGSLANVIKVGDITYLGVRQQGARPITSSDLGAVFAHVQNKLEGQIFNW